MFQILSDLYYQQKTKNHRKDLLLLGDTDSLALVSSGLGVLATGSEAPVVTQTTMGTDLLQTLQVLTDLVVQDISHHLIGLTILVVPLSIEEPVRNLVLTGILSKSKEISFPLNNFKLTCMMVMIFSTSSSHSSPALLCIGMSAFFSTMLAYLN